MIYLLIALALAVGATIYLVKQGKIKDSDGDLIPDAVEEVVEEVVEKAKKATAKKPAPKKRAPRKNTSGGKSTGDGGNYYRKNRNAK